MKKTTFEDTGASNDDKIATIVAVGDATIEEASRALAECDGDVDRAMTLVYNQAQAPPSNGITAASTSRKHAPYKHSRTARHMEDDDDESATKPLEQPLRRHPPPSLSTQRSAAARDSECKGKHSRIDELYYYAIILAQFIKNLLSQVLIHSAHKQKTQSCLEIQYHMLQVPFPFMVQMMHGMEDSRRHIQFILDKMIWLSRIQSILLQLNQSRLNSFIVRK
jgi:hypothetical protein